ncbi:MAG: Mrp/NBP35 family ATP-binding protein [bacterium]
MVSFLKKAGDSDNENHASHSEKLGSKSSNQKKFGESDEDFETRLRMENRLGRIKHKIVVLSGKGGVGKSTVAVNLAMSLLLEGFRVGLLDIDIHGPSVPTMLGLTNETVQSEEEGLVPVSIGELKVMSLGFLLKNQDDPVIWRGPMKMGVIKQFLSDVLWGNLDYLIIDSPPGTGDEPLSICQLIDDLDGALIVTTPQKVASVDVRKSISFCHRLNLPVLGVIENMSGFTCPNCGVTTHVFPSGGGMQIARDMKVPFLGSIPLDPKIAQAGDDGRAYIHQYKDSETAKLMRKIIEKIRTAEISDGSDDEKMDSSP